MGNFHSEEQVLGEGVECLRAGRTLEGCRRFDEAIVKGPHARFATRLGRVAERWQALSQHAQHQHQQHSSQPGSPSPNRGSWGVASGGPSPSSVHSSFSVVTQVSMSDRIVVRHPSTSPAKDECSTPPAQGVAPTPVESVNEPEDADRFAATWATRTNPLSADYVRQVAAAAEQHTTPAKERRDATRHDRSARSSVSEMSLGESPARAAPTHHTVADEEEYFTEQRLRTCSTTPQSCALRTETSQPPAWTFGTPPGSIERGDDATSCSDSSMQDRRKSALVSPRNRRLLERQKALATASFFQAAFGELPQYDDSEIEIQLPTSEDDLSSFGKALALRLKIAEALRKNAQYQLAECELVMLRAHARHVLSRFDRHERATPPMLELRRLFVEICISLAKLVMDQLGDPYAVMPDDGAAAAGLEKHVADGLDVVSLTSPVTSHSAHDDIDEITDDSHRRQLVPPDTPETDVRRRGIMAHSLRNSIDPWREQMLRVGTYHVRIGLEHALAYYGERSHFAVRIHILEADLLAALQVYGRSAMALQRAIGIGVSLFGLRRWEGEREARDKLCMLKVLHREADDRSVGDRGRPDSETSSAEFVGESAEDVKARMQSSTARRTPPPSTGRTTPAFTTPPRPDAPASSN